MKAWMYPNTVRDGIEILIFGQSCDAPTRMLEETIYENVQEAVDEARKIKVDIASKKETIRSSSLKVQYDKILS